MKSTVIAALLLVAGGVVQSSDRPEGKYYEVSGQFLRPYGAPRDSACDYTVRSGKGDWWSFGLLLPKEEPVVLAGGGSQFVVLPGVLKHEENPGPKTVESKQPGYDYVYAVIDVGRCRVKRFISMTTDPDLSRFALADEEAILMVAEKGTTRVYAGTDFALAGELPIKTVLFGLSVYPRWVSAFSNGFVVAPAMGGTKEKGPLFLIVHMEGSKLESWKAVHVPLPKANFIPRGSPLLSAEGSEGEITYSVEPVFADSQWIVLRFKSEFRKQGQASGSRGALWGYNYATATVTAAPLSVDATLLHVKALSADLVEFEFSMAGLRSRAVLSAPTAKERE